jgi:PhnB protein
MAPSAAHSKDAQRPVLSLMLAVPDTPAASQWYQRALGATELWSLGSVAGLEIEGAPFFLHEPTSNGFDSPAAIGTTTVRIEVFVDDPDTFIDQAVAAGASGEAGGVQDHQVSWGTHRQGGFHDPFGHNWLVGDKSPLMARRAVTNRTMPNASIIPELAYEDVGTAIDWLRETFGFTERWRAGNHRAQLSFGNGTVVVMERGPQPGRPAGGDDSNSLLVRIDDADAHHDRARRRGARILKTPEDYHYGERQYTAEDIGGHHWTFSQSIADLAPEDWGGTSPD